MRSPLTAWRLASRQCAIVGFSHSFRTRLFSPQLFDQESVAQRSHISGLPVVGCAAVPPFDILEIKNIMALLLHLGEHLSGMSGMDPVVSGRGHKKNARIFLILHNLLIRGIL